MDDSPYSDSEDEDVNLSDLCDSDSEDEYFDPRIIAKTPPSVTQVVERKIDYDPLDTHDDSSICEIVPGRVWSKTSRPTANIVFSEPSGNKPGEFDNLKWPVNYFLKFFDQNIIENILEQSNLYNQQENQKQGKKLIEPITLEELYAFFGLSFFMGFHCLPSVRDYWSTDPYFHVPIASDTMTRNRFLDILSNLHLNDNDTKPAHNKDKLYKLRPLIVGLNENFGAFRLPGQYLSIDESTVKFKGRSVLRMYNSMKPNKRHFKLWAMSEMSSFTFAFDVYQGKETKEPDTASEKVTSPKRSLVPVEEEVDTENCCPSSPKKAKGSCNSARVTLWPIQDNQNTIAPKGRKSKESLNPNSKRSTRAKSAEDALGTKVVMKLVNQLKLDNKNHAIAFDNYYTSLDLMERLAKKGIYAVGTVRSNRVGLPKEMMADKKMKRGDFDYRLSDTGLFYVKWDDNKPVHFLSNYHGFNRCRVKRKLKDGNSSEVNAL